MTHGAMLAMAGASRAAAAAERRVVDAFRLADATARDRARHPDAIGIARDAAFDRLVAVGVLREDARGAFHLDEAALIARRARKPTSPAIVGVLIALAVALLVPLVYLLVRSD